MWKLFLVGFQAADWQKTAQDVYGMLRPDTAQGGTLLLWFVFVISLIFHFCWWNYCGGSLDVSGTCGRLRKQRSLPAKDLTDGGLAWVFLLLKKWWLFQSYNLTSIQVKTLYLDSGFSSLSSPPSNLVDGL